MISPTDSNSDSELMDLPVAIPPPTTQPARETPGITPSSTAPLPKEQATQVTPNTTSDATAPPAQAVPETPDLTTEATATILTPNTTNLLTPTDTSTLSAQLSSYFPTPTTTATPCLYTDTEITHISTLLTASSLPRWSSSPRLYIVLRTINALPLLDPLLAAGISDFWFPFTPTTLPSTLASSEVRDAFVAAQQAVLTKAVDIEKGAIGRHRHFSEDEEVPFDVVGTLGVGGYGAVDKVVSRLSGREYARKRIRRGKVFRRAKDAMRGFKIEVEVLKRLKHRHVVELVGSYSDAVWVGLILAPVAEGDLGWWLRIVEGEGQSGRREEMIQQLKGWIGCLGVALGYLHEQSVRHKDIKPGNILVKGGNVLFTDFGLSLDWTELSRSTTQGASALTPRYCAPEVADFEPRNASSDVWSLGCVWLEMMTVVKGETVAGMKGFYEGAGTHSQFCRSNVLANEEWMRRLEGVGRREDNKPFGQIREMLQVERAKRPTAQELVKMVLRRDPMTNKKTEFCGSCCLDELDEDSSDEEEVDTKEDWDVLDGDSRGAEITQSSSASSAVIVKNGTERAKTKKLFPSAMAMASPNLSKHEKTSQSQKPSFTSTFGSAYTPTTEPGSNLASTAAEKQPTLSAAMVSFPSRIKDSLTKFIKDVTTTTTASYPSTPTSTSTLLSPPTPPFKPLNPRTITMAKFPNLPPTTPLIAAINTGDLPTLYELLKTCPPTDFTTKEATGHSPLYKTVYMGNTQAAHLLLAHPIGGSSIVAEVTDPKQGPKIMSVAMNHEWGLAALLIAYGADIAAVPENGMTALHSAVAYRNVEAVRALLEEYRLPVDSVMKTGVTPLALCANQAYTEAGVEVAKLLLRKGAKVEKLSNALHIPVTVNNVEMVKLLVKAGVPVDGVVHGRTPLAWARYRKSEEMVKVLTELGADPKRTTVVETGKAGKAWDPVAYMTGTTASTSVGTGRIPKAELVDLERKDALIVCAKKGFESGMEKLLGKGGDANMRDDQDGRTALAWAAKGGHEKVVRMLLEKGAKVDAKDDNETTALHLAAEGGHKEVAEALLETGGTIAAKDDYGRTPLHLAAEKGSEPVVDLLIRKGHAIDIKENKGDTPLHCAAAGKHKAVIKRMAAENPEYVNIRTADKRTMLHQAVQNYHDGMVHFLVDMGIDINAKDKWQYTASHLAVQIERSHIAEVLLSKGADFNIKTSGGKTLLHTAASKGNKQLVRLLLDKGAAVDERDNGGWTPLYWAAMENYRPTVQILLDHGANINATGDNGWTMLYWATYCGRMRFVLCLIDKGADVNAGNGKGLDHGMTPLHIAIKRKQVGATNTLLEAGANINAQSEYGATPLHCAAGAQDWKTVKLLVEKGADLTLKTKTGHTALHEALMFWNEWIIKFLIENGADVDAMTDRGENCVSLASYSSNNKEVIKLLQEKSKREAPFQVPLQW